MVPQDILNQFRQGTVSQSVMSEVQVAPQIFVTKVSGFIFNNKYIKMGCQVPFEFLEFVAQILEEEKGLPPTD